MAFTIILCPCQRPTQLYSLVEGEPKPWSQLKAPRSSIVEFCPQIWTSLRQSALSTSDLGLCSVFDHNIFQWSSENAVAERLLRRNNVALFSLKFRTKPMHESLPIEESKLQTKGPLSSRGQVPSASPFPQDVCFGASGFFWNSDQLPLISSQSRCCGDGGDSGLRLIFL